VVNLSFAKLIGLSKEEAEGKTDKELLPPALAEHCRKQDEEIIRRGKIMKIEEDHDFHGETLFQETIKAPLFDERGIVIGLVGITRDITERKRYEVALKRSEEKFRTLFESATDAIFILNLDGSLIDINTTVHERLGYTKDEMLSMHIKEFNTPEFAARIPEQLAEIQKNGMAVFESAHIQKDGTVMPVEVNSRILDYEGRQVCLSIIRDITKRKKAEKELEKACRELEAQNRELRKLDEIKDTLVRDVSHELKTPVAKHSMQMEILKPIAMVHQLSEEEKRAFVVMEESIRRQEGVIRNLLDLSRLEAGERKFRCEAVQLDRLLAKTIEDYNYAIKVHGMNVDLEAPSLVISSDAEMLWHLFSNIVNNAIKFRCKGVPGRIIVTAKQLDGEVQVSVCDNGIGIDKKNMDSVFSRFYQASVSSEGSGVGLTICQMIAKGLGGRILMESEGSGKGLTVIVILPVSKEL
jgi:PAS domain S-box-containing protein